MNFLFPAAFWLAAAAPVIVLLYLRRVKRRRETVSTLLFWQRVVAATSQRRFLGALRNPLSLLLQLLIFLLILLAAVHPRWGREPEPRSTVIVLDARARMQAGGGAAFAKALREAESLAGQAGPDEEVGILAVEQGTRIVSAFSHDAKTLRTKLAEISPSDGGGDLPAAIALGQRLLETRAGKKRLVVISDRPPSQEKDIETVLVGEPRDNIGLVACSARPLPASPQTYEIFLETANFSASAKNTEIEFLLDGRLFETRPLALEAGQSQILTTTIPAEVLRNGEGRFEARLAGTDALKVDNAAFAALSVANAIRVLLVSKGNPFLEEALRANPRVQLEMLTPEDWKPTMLSGLDAVIFDNLVPENPALDSPGNPGLLFFGASPFDVPEKDAGPPGALDVRDPQNPLLWNADLRAAAFARARTVAPPQNSSWRIATPVLSEDERPMIVTLEGAGGSPRLAVFAFGIEDSNLPLRAAFPLLLSNTVQWLAGKEKDAPSSFKAGSVVQMAPEESLSPAGQKNPAGQAVILRRAGFQKIQSADGNSRLIAVNTADTQESDLRAAKSSGGAFSMALAGIVLRPWQWFCLAALALLLLEWRLHHRRLTE